MQVRQPEHDESAGCWIISRHGGAPLCRSGSDARRSCARGVHIDSSRTGQNNPATGGRSRGDTHMHRLLGAALGGFVLLAPAAQAQGYPERVIHVISPNPPGGANDTILRVVAARMAPVLGGAIVIDNRGGGAGRIGAEAVARAAPDGYTLLAGSVSTHSFAPVVTPKLGYDPVKDFEPISLLALV